MAVLFIRVFLIFVLASLTHVGVQGRPRFAREAANSNDSQFRVVMTQYGQVRGRRLQINDQMDLEIYLGVRYAKAPVGELRFARPEPPTPWNETRDALEHGAMCLQRIISQDHVLENVPFSEDCLFLDIYTPRYKDGSISRVPTMMFIHGGGYYGGTGAKYNFTNVALRGVTVVSVSYRLDIFGFLSTQDDVIPGNFGLLDNILALEWIKNNIAEFGGNSGLITLFGGSSGASIASILTMSPLSRGKAQGAIMQSGAISCPWSVYVPGMQYAVPRDLAKQLGSILNCSQPGDDFSQELLRCLRAAPAEVLASESLYFQEQLYQDNMIFIPVVETAFGVIPDTPLNLLRKTDELYHIPTMYGYMADDGAFMVSDPDNDGITLEEFKMAARYVVAIHYPPDEQDAVYNNALSKYLPKDPSKLSKLDLREILVQAATGEFCLGRTIREARYFSKAARGDQSDMYVFEFNHRPSYSPYPAWMGVNHAAEKGFVLGLPVGPDPFMYPNYTRDDEIVADFVMTTWTNFAKYGNPTPSPVHSIKWPQFKPGSDEKVMVIQTSPQVKDFDREVDVKVWASEDSENNGGNGGNRWQVQMSMWVMCLLVVMVL